MLKEVVHNFGKFDAMVTLFSEKMLILHTWFHVRLNQKKSRKVFTLNGQTYFCFVKQQLYLVPIPYIQNILYGWARIALDIAVGTM